MAMEPIAVTPHDNSEIAPTCAMLAGSMMMPEPIMLTATSTVSCIRLIFFVFVAFITGPLWAWVWISRGQQKDECVRRLARLVGDARACSAATRAYAGERSLLVRAANRPTSRLHRWVNPSRRGDR